MIWKMFQSNQNHMEKDTREPAKNYLILASTWKKGNSAAAYNNKRTDQLYFHRTLLNRYKY